MADDIWGKIADRAIATETLLNECIESMGHLMAANTKSRDWVRAQLLLERLHAHAGNHYDAPELTLGKAEA